MEIGLVSPQFYCHHDDMFETTTGVQSRSIPKSRWKEKGGLMQEEHEVQVQQVIQNTTTDENQSYSSDEEDNLTQPNEGDGR